MVDTNVKFPIATDIVVFTIYDHQLNVLLVQRMNPPYQDYWALPGGLVKQSESLQQCAVRKLAEKSGVSGIYLEQLYTFSNTDIDVEQRVVTVAYFALLPYQRLQTRIASQSNTVACFALTQLPQLAFDHAAIIKMAKKRLLAKLDYSTIAFQLLPKKFTLSELQLVYETILGQKIDKRNFRKRVLALKQVQETGEEKRVGACRPARLYQLKKPDQVDIIK